MTIFAEAQAEREHRACLAMSTPDLCDWLEARYTAIGLETDQILAGLDALEREAEAMLAECRRLGATCQD